MPDSDTANFSSVPLLGLLLIAVVAVVCCCCYINKKQWTDTQTQEGFTSAIQSSPPVPVHSTEGPAPLEYKMGDYDGIPLRTKCKGGWRSPPCTAPLSESTRNETVQGHQLPLELTPTVLDFTTAPPIDGQVGQPRSDFMFAYNQSSPFCCPATYSSSTGCVCTTPEQRDWLQRRGNNSNNMKSDL